MERLNMNCRPFTCTKHLPRIICDSSLSTFPHLTGNEIFINNLAQLHKNESEEFSKTIIHTLKAHIQKKQADIQKNEIDISNTSLILPLSTLINKDKMKLLNNDEMISIANDEMISIANNEMTGETKNTQDTWNLPVTVVIENNSCPNTLILALGVALTGSNVSALIIFEKEALETSINVLKTLEILKSGVNVISCPTCGRCRQDLENIVREVKRSIRHIKVPLTIAIMGCEVNGPGEASHADAGLAASKTGMVLFTKDNPPKDIPTENAAKALIDKIEELAQVQRLTQ